ncbi:MAG: hypothetical protein L0Y56_12600, partial [Nitrospira sp.]|nr:hypothetical protein [Nitrospira sp.]
PTDVKYDSSRQWLFVADSRNNRVVAFNVKPNRTTNGENAVLLFGQANYTEATPTSPPTESSLNTTKGLVYDVNNFRLYTADSGNHRILRHVLPQLTTTKLASGTNGVIAMGAPYSETINATGAIGVDPAEVLTLTVTSGSLPLGLFMASDGLISGTPTALGIHCFNIRVQDQHGVFDEREYYLHVAPTTSTSPGTHQITTPYLPRGVRGHTYGIELTASGGTPNYRWSATGLPQNFQINPCSGRIDAPHITVVGNFTVQITSTDLNNQTAMAFFSLSITSYSSNNCPISTTELPTATKGEYYVVILNGVGCDMIIYELDTLTPPPSTLPPGLTLIDYYDIADPLYPTVANLLTPQLAVIVGTPTQATGTSPHAFKIQTCLHHGPPTTCDSNWALFMFVDVSLTVTKAGTGGGTVTSSPAGINCGSDCSESYNSSTVVTLTATPDSTSTFTGWSGDSDCSDGSVTMNTNKICTANFNTATQTFSLTATKAGTGNGTVTSNPAGINCGPDCSEPYTSGTMVTLTATPDSTSTFTGWSGDSDCSDGSVTMNANKTCTATFNPIPTYTLTVTPPTGGTIASTSPASPVINCGTTCSATYSS